MRQPIMQTTTMLQGGVRLNLAGFVPRQQRFATRRVFQETSEPPQGFGVRQSSAAFARGTPSESGRGLPHSKTLARPRKRQSVRGFFVAALVLACFWGDASAAGPPTDLRVSLFPAGEPVHDREFHYVISVENVSTVDATGVTVVSPTPTNAAFSPQITACGGTCSVTSNGVSCSLGTLAAAATATIELTLTPTQLGDLVLAATVSSNDGDTTPQDNSTNQLLSVRPGKCQTPTHSVSNVAFAPLSGGRLALRWQSSAGVFYRLERTKGLASTNWIGVTSLPGNGEMLSVTQNIGTGSWFYRVVANCNPPRLGSWGQAISSSVISWDDDLAAYVRALWETGQNFCIYPIDFDRTIGLPQWEDFQLLLEQVKGTDFQVFAAIGAPHLANQTRWHRPGFVPCNCPFNATTWDYNSFYACKQTCMNEWLYAWTNAAETLSQLSLTYSNLAGLVINDFDTYVESADYPACLFGDRLTHDQVKEISDAAHRHNPRFGFWPTCYYSFGRTLGEGYVLGANYGVSLIAGEEMSVTFEFSIAASPAQAQFSFLHADSVDESGRHPNLFKEVLVNGTMLSSESVAGDQAHQYFETNILPYLVLGTNSITLRLRAAGGVNGCTPNKFWYIWNPVVQIANCTRLVDWPFTATRFGAVALNTNYFSTAGCQSGAIGTNRFSNSDLRRSTACAALPDDPTLGYSARYLVAAPSASYSTLDLVDGIVAPFYPTSAPRYDAQTFGLLLDAAVGKLRGKKLLALQLGTELTAVPALNLTGLAEQLRLASSRADYVGLWEMPLGVHYLDDQLGMFAEHSSNTNAYNFLAYWPPKNAVQGWYQRWRSTPALLGTNVQVTIADLETSANGFLKKVYWDKGAAGQEIIWQADVAGANDAVTLGPFTVTNTLVLAAEIGPLWTFDALIYFNVVNPSAPGVDLGPHSGFWTFETGVNTKSQQTYDTAKQVFLELRK